MDGNGHGPASPATGPNDEIRIQVCYVEVKPKARIRALAGQTASDIDNAVWSPAELEQPWGGTSTLAFGILPDPP